jgi:hypothetical protein
VSGLRHRGKWRARRDSNPPTLCFEVFRDDHFFCLPDVNRPINSIDHVAVVKPELNKIGIIGDSSRRMLVLRVVTRILSVEVWTNFGAAQGQPVTHKRNRSNDLD